MSKQILILFFSILISCQKNTGPEAFLSQFERKLIQSDQSREGLKLFLTVDALQKYEYAKRFQGGTLIKKIKFIYSNCKGNSCTYTYDITYRVEKSGSTSFIDVRKQAVLKKVEKAWKIDDIEIIKSYMNNKKAIDI